MAKQWDDANAFLMGSESVPSASFLTKGTNHQGEILEIKMRQQLDIDTRKPLFWENGDPKMQLVVTLQTDEQDDEIEDDDGRRRLYLKYKMKDAVSDAVREAGAENGLEVGGWLSVTFVKQDKPEKRGKSGVKHFEAEYEAPDPNAAANEYLNSDDPDGDDGDAPDEPPARVSKQRPAKAKAPARRGARAAAEPDDDADVPPARPTRGRGRPAAGGASKSAGRARRSEYVNDDDGGDEPF
jgi:hypothetical protein